MTPYRWSLSLMLLTCWPIGVHAQKSAPSDAVIIYKDGFTLKGRVNERVSQVIFDRASGRSFAIPSGEFGIDDHVRNILFSPGQIQKVVEIKPGTEKKPTVVQRIKTYSQHLDVNPAWEIENPGEWSKKGDRTVQMSATNGRIEMVQHIGLLTPHHILAITKSYRWNPMYFTQEFGPELTRDILVSIFNEKKDLKSLPDAEKLLKIAAFLQEAGWYAEAERELMRCITNFPLEKKTAQEMLNQLKEVRANLFVDGIKQASSVGQHQEVLARLETYDKENFQKLVTADNRLAVQDVKAEYNKIKTDMDQARTYLKAFPPLTVSPRDWSKACVFIQDELNIDTVGRLKAFLTFALQHDDELKKNSKPTQTTEQVLAMAVTGWLQGNQAAEPDAKMALQLSRMRETALAYLKTEDETGRKKLLSSFKGDSDLPADVIVRLMRMIPPPYPLSAKKLNTEIMTMSIEGGDYLLQLPPEYHHLRSYPVVMLLSSGREKADELLARFTPEAAKRGWILAAPVRAGNVILKSRSQSSEKEYALVINTLRDLRRRFQIDSDRVFLFGWEEGANLAFDVGLGHPDLFAGVVPMCGTIPLLTRRFYWPNAQYLPFYIIDGDRNGGNPKTLRELFKSWTRDPYAVTYVEYKGRASEWFSAEIPLMLDWMSHKKRHHPAKEMGRYSGAGGLGEEFRSTRSVDNRFYWLSSEEIADRCLTNHNATSWPTTFKPATFQANLSLGNETDSKKSAKIWNQVNVRISGVKQVTLWIAPNMMDFTKPLSVRVNGEQVGPMRTIQPNMEALLEELFSTGDRQRLIVAKIDMKL